MQLPEPIQIFFQIVRPLLYMLLIGTLLYKLISFFSGKFSKKEEAEKEDEAEGGPVQKMELDEKSKEYIKLKSQIKITEDIFSLGAGSKITDIELSGTGENKYMAEYEILKAAKAKKAKFIFRTGVQQEEESYTIHGKVVR